MKKLTKTQKNKIRRVIVLVSAALIVALTVFFIIIKLFSVYYKTGTAMNEISKTDYSEYDVDKPEITEMFLTENINSRPGKKLSKVNGVVVHYTANPGTDAEANRNYFESRKDMPDNNKNKVSSHFVIGLDGTIIQCIPLDEIAYASNDRNADTISIECCHPDKSGKFNEATYDSLIHLIAWLCKKYEFNRDRIIRHYDVSGKLCPLYYVEHEDKWEKLKRDAWKCFLNSKKTV